MLVLAGVWLLLAWCVASSQIQIDESVPVMEATVLLAEVARLPCALQPPDPEDQVALVIWFKDDNASPIYSVDSRGRGDQRQATHWADDRRLGGRSFFRVSSPDPPGPHLAIEGVRTADAGSYRCRVDFRHSPTRNSVVKLNVVVPPDNVTILDEKGLTVRELLGPYPEGEAPRVSCIAVGGRPIPKLFWRLDGIMLQQDSVSEDSLKTGPSHGLPYVRSFVQLPRLARHHLQSALSCHAVSSQQLPPIVVSTRIHLILAPLSARLKGENKPLSAGKPYDVSCETAGSRPSSNLTWWKDGEQLLGAKDTSTNDDNVTVSDLTVVLHMDDSGKQLCCLSTNPVLAGSALHDCWTLRVRYSPVVSLELGSNINASAIREGVDVYFECSVHADPWIHKIAWRHNGRQLNNNASAGTLLANQTLVLQAVTRNSSGLYTCVASNSEGDTESNAFNLDVKFAPECRPGQQLVWGAARREMLSVPCAVDARPPATLFRWAFNSSAADTRSLDTGIFATEPGHSVLQFQPLGERDYGTLLCWGRNELGAQRHPCVFHIVPAGRPDTPHSCHLLERSATSLHVLCSRGSDGGLPQQFTMELHTAAPPPPPTLVANVTNRSRPEFVLDGLEPGTAYTATVYSSNGKGRSAQAATLNVATPRLTQQQHQLQTDEELTTPRPPQRPPSVTPWLLVSGILGSIIVLLVFLGVVVAISVRRRRAATSLRKAPPSLPSSDENPDVVPQKEDSGTSSVDYGSLQQFVAEVRRPVTVVDSAAQTTALYGQVNTFSLTEAVVLAPCWPEQPLPLVLETTPRLDAETQTPVPSRHKESAV